MGDVVRFAERGTPRKLLYVLVVATAVLVAVFGVVVWQTIEQPGDTAAQVSLYIVMGFVLLVMLSLLFAVSSFSVVLNSKVLRFGFRTALLRKSVPLDQIDSAEATTVSWMSYGGCGVRMKSCSDIGYIADSGEGVTICLRGGKRYTFSCEGSKELVALLRSSA